MAEYSTEAEENNSISTGNEAEAGQQTSPKPTESPASKLNDNWTWEIVSCFLCIACLACIVAVLLEYDGKPLPEWPYGITINSILSWITQVFTACMVGVVATCLSQSKWIYFTDGAKPLAHMDSYDWASRGPAGCSVFLWTSRMRQFATLGALITILSIGTGPFVQQMVTVKNSRVVSDSPASIARTESFFEPDAFNMQPIKSEMKSVIYNAIFSSSDTTSTNSESTSFSSHTKPDCPTGDCIIPRFQSLAACSYCSNVSHLLSVKEGQSPCYGEQTPQHVYYLPNGLNISVSSNSTALPLYDGLYFSTGTKSDRDRHGLEAMALPGTKDFGDSAFMNLTAIFVGTDSVEQRVVNATAMQCSLYWCVNTYTVTVKNGSTSEPVLESYYDNTASFSARYANHEDSTIVLQPPVSGSMTPSNFTIQQTSSNGLSRWLADKFQFRRGNSLCPETDVGFTGHGSDFIPFFENQPLPQLFSRIAAGITTYMRSANELVFVPTHPEVDMYRLSHDGTEPAHGTAWTVQTLIYIHWGWITLPAILLVLTMAFLVITALQSRNRSLNIWKSSTLPLLCSGLGLDFQRDLRMAGGPTRVEDEANKLNVKCVMGPEGPDRWRLDAMERKAG